MCLFVQVDGVPCRVSRRHSLPACLNIRHHVDQSERGRGGPLYHVCCAGKVLWRAVRTFNTCNGITAMSLHKEAMLTEVFPLNIYIHVFQR